MVLGSIVAGAAGGATVSIVINAVDNFSRTFGKANAGMAKLGAGLTVVGIAGGLAVGGILKLASSVEDAEIAFTTMLGSGEKAQKLLKDLTDFAARTPFTIPGIRQNAKMLLAMGVELDDMIPTLKALGDVSAGLSVPLQRLALNFGQVKTIGKLTGRELRDFSFAGVPLVAELAKNLNKTEKEIGKMVTAGKIGFKDVEKAFETMSGAGGKFANLMEEKNKALSGQISNLIDNFIKLGEEMGKHLLPIAKNVTEALVKLTDLFEEHPLITKWVTITLALGTAFALIVGPLLLIVALLPAISAGFGILAGTAAATNTQLAITRGLLVGPTGLVFLFGTLAGILLYEHAKSVRDAAEAYDTMGGAIDKNVGKLKDMNEEMMRTTGIGGTRITQIEVGGDLAKQLENFRVDFDQLSESSKTTKQLQLIQQAQAAGLKAIQTRFATPGGITPKFDVFDPGNLRPEDFESFADFKRAERGGGITINIENINGIDPDEIAAALNDKLNNMIDT